MTVNALSAASLAIYVLLLKPTLYTLYRHGWPGFLGWFYLHLFCVVRIVGNALSLHTPLHPTAVIGGPGASGSSKSSLIVNNIGLSPLLLTAAGLLHEARRARRVSGASSAFEWSVVVQYHLLVSGALGLIVAGIVILEEGKVGGWETAKAVMKSGAAVVVVCWVLLVMATAGSLFGAQGKRGAALDWRAGSLLLHAVVVVLPLIALRLVYGVAVLLLDVTGHPADKFATSLAAKVVLSTVPEIVLVIVFIAVGIMTKDIAGAYWRKGGKRRGVGADMTTVRA